MPKDRHEVAGKEEDHEGLWSRNAKFCVLKVQKCFMQLYRRAGMRLLENDLTMKGYGRKRRSFGEINQW